MTIRLNLRQVVDLFHTDRQIIIDWITEVIEDEYKDSVLRELIIPIFANDKSKKLRPLIALYVYRSIAGPNADITNLKLICAAIEISHNASLIVDDIFDKDNLRRGEESFYVKYGTFTALSAAYNLSAFVFDLATRTNIPSIVREFGRVGTALSSSLYLSKDLKTNKPISKDFFMNLLYRKTSALFEGSSLAGAMLASNDKELLKLYSKFGEYFGNAYQLRDDVLAIVGTIDDLGKLPDSDITNRFQSLITIEGMENGNDWEKQTLNDYYLRNKSVNPETIREILIKTGAVHKVMDMAIQYRDQALYILKQFPKSQSLELLSDLTRLINFESIKTRLDENQ